MTKYLTACISLALACGFAIAAESAKNQPPSKATVATEKSSPAAKVTAVTSVGPRQAGYVHYFVITHPDESLEYHVGIELEDQRIAWSFPNAGVIVSEFIKKGTLDANGKLFKVEHLHGIRPFGDETQMLALQKALTPRVAQWVDNETPYCLIRRPGQPFCLSCGDFVVRVLYPGATPLVPAMPRDLARGPGATTDDLLLYLVGVHNLPDKQAKLARLATLDLPTNMREDITAMINSEEPEVAAVATAPSRTTPTAQNAPLKPLGNKIASRRPQTKKL